VPQKLNEERDTNPQQYVCIIQPPWDWKENRDEAALGNGDSSSDGEQLEVEYGQYIDKMKPLFKKPAANHLDHKWVMMVCYP
jgi:hypothetical protein